LLPGSSRTVSCAFRTVALTPGRCSSHHANPPPTVHVWSLCDLSRAQTKGALRRLSFIQRKHRRRITGVD
jgi:hypothetical protein